ncbi:MAG: TetR/AcrR family transcriptional regulator SczA [Anaerolineae bacterium]
MDVEERTRYERRKARTRHTLKEAAAALLVEKGYEALTIQDITDRLDLARATFYVHFKDKDDVIWSVLQDHFDALNEKVHTELNTPSPGRHYQKLLHIFEYAAAQKALLSVMLSERGHIRLVQRFARYVALIITQDMEQGFTPSMPGASVAFTAQFLAGALIQVLTWWLESGEDLTPEQLTRMFYALEARTNSA